MAPRRARRAVTVRPPLHIREHPSLSDATLVMTMEDMIHATFGSEECNTVDFKLFETVLTILGRRLNLLDQKVSIVDIDVGDEDRLTEGIQLISPYPMTGRKESSVKADAINVLTAFLGQLTDELSERISKDQTLNLDTASFLELLDNNSKKILSGLIKDVERKTEGKFLVDEYLKPFLHNLRGISNSSAIIDLEGESYQIVKWDKSFEKKNHLLGSEVVSSAVQSPPSKRKSHIEEEALAILGLLRSTFPVQKIKNIIIAAQPGSVPPQGWPENLPWLPEPGTPWPKGVSWPPGTMPPPPSGWPKGMPWPPKPGTKWPPGVYWPDESDNSQEVKIPEGMMPPAGWPKELAWPPPPGTAWPPGVSYETGGEALAPPGWPEDLLWPPQPATAWPVGVAIPAGMAAPQGWPVDLPWPPQPGTSWPSGASWPNIGEPQGLPLEATARRSTLILTAQRVPSKTSSKTSNRVGTVECVTVSQFELLKKTVNELKKISGPIPMPTMPLNKKLIKEVTSGSASLTDTMEAMKVVSRVQAMEDAVARLSEMVSALASGIGNKVQEQELQVVKAPRSWTGTEAPSPKYQVPATSNKPSVASMGVPCVTRAELANALGSLRGLLSQEVEEMKNKITTAADASVVQGKIIMEKLEDVVNISLRINALQEIIAEYYQQLEGMEGGIHIQIKTFHDQLTLLRNDLDCGLNLLANVNSNKETLAVMDLTERYDGLVGDLDGLLHLHSTLDDKQRSIADQLRHLIHAVERVSEQKADHDELADGLKDKADQSTLAGLLTEQEFLKAMEGIKEQLEACYVKFNKQDHVWHEALNDLLKMIDQKVDYSKVFSWKDQTLEELQQLHCQVKLLAVAVGEPKAALLARRMARDAFCGACAESAFMNTEESQKARSEPNITEDSICIGSYKKLFAKEEEQRHLCKRWVGGSHTLITPAVVTRGRAETPDFHVTPMRRYMGTGKDGKVYQCASELKPCSECNVQHPTPRAPPPPPPAAAAVPPRLDGSQRASIHEVMGVGEQQPQLMASEQTVVPVESFIQPSPERKSSIVSRVRGVNSTLNIVATHGNINSDNLQ